MQRARKKAERLPFFYLVVFSGILFLAGCGGGGVSRLPETYTLKLMDLEIIVEKGGSVAAAENREVRCDVMGQSRIIYLIPEGSMVKKDDVLVKLDSSDLEDSLTRQEMAYQTALAGKIQAEELYEIQKSQNKSNISKARLDLEFAIMDFRKYTGYKGPLTAFSRILNEGLDSPGLGDKNMVSAGADNSVSGASDGPVLSASDGPVLSASDGPVSSASDTPVSSNSDDPVLSASDTPVLSASDGPVSNKSEIIDLAKFFDKPLEEYKNGEAAQLWRQQDSNLSLAESRYKIALYNREGSEELFKKDFISKTKRDADVLDCQTMEINLTKAKEDLRLLKQFTHPRNLKLYISDLNEKSLELDRVKRLARAQLSQKKADLNAMLSKYDREKELKEKFEKQVKNCMITAPGPGLVVYARPHHGWRSEDLIEEGTMVHERQRLINLPDLSNLVVDLQIHESKISLVKVGQSAVINIESLQGVSLKGKVLKVGILPDNVNRFFNPDLKVYNVKVSIDNKNGLDLKPGLTANVKIFVDRVPGVFCVPVQAVISRGTSKLVQVINGSSIERRQVEVGKYNDMYVEIKSGLKEGEKVLLDPKIEEIKGERKGKGAGNGESKKRSSELTAGKDQGQGEQKGIYKESKKLQGQSPTQRRTKGGRGVPGTGLRGRPGRKKGGSPR